MAINIAIVILLTLLVLLLSVLVFLLYRRTLPPYKPNRHRQKPSKEVTLHGPSGTFKIVNEQKHRPKIFTEEEIWTKLNDHSRGNSNSIST